MKNRLETYFILVLLFTITISCGGSDSDDEPIPPLENQAPTQVAQLIYPSPDLLCIDDLINFKWEESTDPENDVIRYRITITSDRAQTQIVKQLNISVNAAIIDLEKGKPFYWSVIAIDSKNNQSVESIVQAFYTSGSGVSNHAPFTATVVAPGIESAINAGNIVLSWTGSDPDAEDSLNYELFFGESESPPLLQADISDTSFNIDVVSAKMYYWKVNTIDGSGVKTIGQVWEFTTN